MWRPINILFQVYRAPSRSWIIDQPHSSREKEASKCIIQQRCIPPPTCQLHSSIELNAAGSVRMEEKCYEWISCSFAINIGRRKNCIKKKKLKRIKYSSARKLNSSATYLGCPIPNLERGERGRKRRVVRRKEKYETCIIKYSPSGRNIVGVRWTRPNFTCETKVGDFHLLRSIT